MTAETVERTDVREQLHDETLKTLDAPSGLRARVRTRAMSRSATWPDPLTVAHHLAQDDLAPAELAAAAREVLELRQQLPYFAVLQEIARERAGRLGAPARTEPDKAVMRSHVDGLLRREAARLGEEDISAVEHMRGELEAEYQTRREAAFAASLDAHGEAVAPYTPILRECTNAFGRIRELNTIIRRGLLDEKYLRAVRTAHSDRQAALEQAQAAAQAAQVKATDARVQLDAITKARDAAGLS